MGKAERIQGVRGMNDVLPTDEAYWNRFEEAVVSVMRGYGYRRIRTPIVEPTALFVRGIGEVTDIVEKEMYSFTDALNGDELTLRPESTAGVVRAVIEHNLLYDGPKRLWYQGPMFRHERPQKGRYRQFDQVGVEAMGMAGPDADVEVILLGNRLWDELGLGGVRLEINSLGQADERNAHRAALIAYFEEHREELDGDAQRRLHANPLRILDTKNPAMQALVEAAPRLGDFLGAESLAHFTEVQRLLGANNVAFRINPRLVRGLDYYNLTVFEWVNEDGLTLCGGGRYDPLIAMLGGNPAPACGFALGVERVLEQLRRNAPDLGATGCDVYVIHAGGAVGEVAFQTAESLRDAGLEVILHCGGGSFKSQFRRADASGARFAVIAGEDELSRGEVSVKWLRGSPIGEGAARQETVALAALADWIVDAMVASDGEDI